MGFNSAFKVLMPNTAVGLWQREANYLDIPKALVTAESKGRKEKPFLQENIKK